MSSRFLSAPAANQSAQYLRWMRDRDAVRAIAPHWQRIFESASGQCPECAWPFIEREYLQNQQHAHPLFLTVFDQGELVGILPFIEPKRRLFGASKVIKSLGFDRSIMGRALIIQDGLWSPIEAELRDFLTRSPYETIAIRRPAIGLETGAYVTDYAQTRVMRKVSAREGRFELEGDWQGMITEKARAWMPAFASAQLKISSYEEIGEAARLLDQICPSPKSSIEPLASMLCEEGDGFIAWLELSGKVVAAQLFAQTRDALLVLSGGGSALTCLQLRVFVTAKQQGVKTVWFNELNPDWSCPERNLVEELVIVRQ